MSTRFTIAFDGNLRDGVDRAEVVRQLVSRFRMPEDKAVGLFTGERTILKKGLDSEQARRYLEQLSAIGMELKSLAERRADDEPAPAADDYRIVFAGGVLDGRSREQVMAAARDRLRLDGERLDHVFSGRELGIKHGLDEAGARRYLELLRGLGMDVWCEPGLAGGDPAAGALLPSDTDGGIDDAERQMMETAFWSDATEQLNPEDDLDSRLLEAMSAEFELPLPQREAGGGHDGAGCDDALMHMAETVVDPAAMMMYAHEIADAGNRMTASAVDIAPVAIERNSGAVLVDVDRAPLAVASVDGPTAEPGGDGAAVPVADMGESLVAPDRTVIVSAAGAAATLPMLLLAVR